MGRYILGTPRLTLEEVDVNHLESLIDLLTNKKVHKYFPKTLNKTEALQFYNKMQVRYHDNGYGLWAVLLKPKNRFIGICGLVSQLIDNQTEVEVGYRFLDSFWGNGYATEAAKGSITYAQDILNLESIISLIRDINLPSIKVAKRNGLHFEKDTIFGGSPHRIYRKMLLRK